MLTSWQRFSHCVKLAYRLLLVYIQGLRGAWRLSGLQAPVVTFFGGSRLLPNDHYFIFARTLAKNLMDNNISVITGGGPGIMEAANCGVRSGKSPVAKGVGIGVKNLGNGHNSCVQEYIEVDYFFARKMLLIGYSNAFVIFPGGYGTMDELSDLLTLMQTERIERAPVVLVGKEFWSTMMQWLHDEVVTQHKFMTLEELHLIVVSDDLNEVFCLITKACGWSKDEQNNILSKDDGGD